MSALHRGAAFGNMATRTLLHGADGHERAVPSIAKVALKRTSLDVVAIDTI